MKPLARSHRVRVTDRGLEALHAFSHSGGPQIPGDHRQRVAILNVGAPRQRHCDFGNIAWLEQRKDDERFAENSLQPRHVVAPRVFVCGQTRLGGSIQGVEAFDPGRDLTGDGARLRGQRLAIHV